MRNVSIVIVHYHTPQYLERLVDSICEISDLQQVTFEIIIVNNGGRLNLELSRSFVKEVISSQNLGYGGGINLGMTYATGEYLFFMNADLKLLEGCLTRLIGLLKDADVVGPRFYLDADQQIILPPTQKHDLSSKVMEKLGGTFRLALRLFEKKWWLETRRHLLAQSPIGTNLLSGALIGTKRETWSKVGPFDENFFLYFEETDWLSRARRLGLIIKHDPLAKVVHHFNQSAKKEPQTATWYANSARYFSKKYHSKSGRLLLWMLDNIAVRSASVQTVEPWERTKSARVNEFEQIALEGALPQTDSECFLQMSIYKSFVPSATILLKNSNLRQPFSLSMEVWNQLADGSYYFRVVDHHGIQIAP